MLDGLPVDSYIEKGILVDISDIIEPMKDSGELLNNVVESYINSGKLYALPTRIGIPIITGDAEYVSKFETIDGLESLIVS